MQMNGNKGLALIIIACGALILLSKIGFGFGSLFGYLFPAALMVLGYIGIRNGSKLFGWAMFVIGLIILMGKLSGFLSILVALGLIIGGIAMLKHRKSVY